MNMPRMLIIGLAVIAAAAAAFLARNFLGGGTPNAAAMAPPPPSIQVAEVLVASQPLQPGQALNPTMVHWQKWPKDGIDGTFIRHEDTPNLETALTGTVVRVPMVEGEPLTNVKFVHGDAAGFMAATLQPGMRAVSITVTTESGAGGFILPNDRVDIIMSEMVSDAPRRFSARVVLANIRVLAMDQTYKQDKDQKVVLAKTATLEVTPLQASVVVKAQATGPLSLSLRALGDNSTPPPVAANAGHPANDNFDGGENGNTNTVPRIIRFGVLSAGSPTGRKE